MISIIYTHADFERDETVKANLDDRISCAYHAAIERSDWHGHYGWDENEERQKKALSLAKRSGELSNNDQVPELIKEYSDLHLAYLIGLTEEYRPPIREFFDVERSDDLVKITPLEGVGVGCLRIKRGDSVPMPLGWNCNPSYESYDRFMNEEPPVSELRGLYYDDYNENPEFSLIYAANFNSDISFGYAERKGDRWTSREYVLSEQTMFALIALNEIIGSKLFSERSDKEILEIKQRAREIFNRTKQPCFMPPDGICYSCKSDVTKLLINASPSESITGCPKCGRTWCD